MPPDPVDVKAPPVLGAYWKDQLSSGHAPAARFQIQESWRQKLVKILLILVITLGGLIGCFCYIGYSL